MYYMDVTIQTTCLNVLHWSCCSNNLPEDWVDHSVRMYIKLCSYVPATALPEISTNCGCPNCCSWWSVLIGWAHEHGLLLHCDGADLHWLQATTRGGGIRGPGLWPVSTAPWWTGMGRSHCCSCWPEPPGNRVWASPLRSGTRRQTKLTRRSLARRLYPTSPPCWPKTCTSDPNRGRRSRKMLGHGGLHGCRKSGEGLEVEGSCSAWQHAPSRLRLLVRWVF